MPDGQKSNHVCNPPRYRIILILGVFLSILMAGGLTGRVTGQGVQIDFGETKIENHYPEGMRFSIKIDVTDEVGSIYFHYRLGSAHWEYDYAKCSAKLIGTEVDYYSCIFFLDTTDIPPQVPIAYKWQFFGSADRTSDEQTTRYEDLQFEWKSRTSGNLSVWYHDRSATLAEQSLVTAEEAVRNLEPLFGITLSEPIQIVIENSRLEYETWKLNPSSFVGGQAFPRLGTTIQIVDPGLTELQLRYWLQEVVPHEISHLYFYKATGHGIANPPVWLNEGFAGYSEFGNHGVDWLLIRNAIAEDKLIHLIELREEFGNDEEKLALAYAESFTAAEFLITTHGAEAVKSLFSAYRNGQSNDEAFLIAFGGTQSEIEGDWETWVVKKSNREFQLLSGFGLIALLIVCFCCLGGLIISGLGIFFIFRSLFKSTLASDSRMQQP